ncbi:HIT domain-containing protein [Candidatus Woesearchaeota archaeon]|nr:HIT domain-containing protein [Candidatus Woesearchaeota archaeon]
MKLEFTKKDLSLLLKKYKYWTLYLSPQQYYLGKLQLVLNRKSVIDLCVLKKSETQELLEIIKRSKNALIKCFNPDLFNYATLGNCVRHHHWHIIPRYKSKRIVNNIIFRDEYWNHPSWPIPYKKVSKKTIEKIHNLILNEL